MSPVVPPQVWSLNNFGTLPLFSANKQKTTAYFSFSACLKINDLPLHFMNITEHGRLRITTCKTGRLRLKCDGTRAETRFRLSAKRTIPFKSAGASVQSTAGSRGVRISGSNVGYTMFRGSVKGTRYPLHSPVSPSLPLRALPCAISPGVYWFYTDQY